MDLRRPAHKGLFPQKFNWVEVSNKEKELLSRFFALETFKTIEKSLEGCDSLYKGFYRLIGKESLFIKIIDETHFKCLNESKKIIDWLTNYSAPVNSIKEGFPKRLDDLKICINAFDYLNFRYTQNNTDDIYKIGESLGALHLLLKSYPNYKKIRENGTKLNLNIFDKFKSIKSGKDKTFSEDIDLICKNFDLEKFKIFFSDAQVIHGDLNPGNILFDFYSQEPVFIDFEDILYSWFNPLYDLIYIVVVN